MVTKTIKGVSPEAWARLKAISARKMMPVGKLVEELVEFYEPRADEVWGMLLAGKKILSDKEARAVASAIAEFKKEASWFKI